MATTTSTINTTPTPGVAGRKTISRSAGAVRKRAPASSSVAPAAAASTTLPAPTVETVVLPPRSVVVDSPPSSALPPAAETAAVEVPVVVPKEPVQFTPPLLSVPVIPLVDEEEEENGESNHASSSTSVDTPLEKPTRGKRRTVTKESVFADFEKLYDELSILGTMGKKNLYRALKTLKSDVYRLLKLKTHERKASDVTNSGFMKPVDISPALEEFLRTDGDTIPNPITRAILTTRLCEYVRNHNLQNPKDRREIYPDLPLQKLFHLKEGENLTYYNIQRLIQPHILTQKKTATVSA